MRHSTAKSDQFLISEQPGKIIFFAGLIFSFLCGYTIKSYFSPTRIYSQIERAASNIHRDVKVQFDSAELSFSDGVFPQFAIIIKNIQMESEKSCWGQPLLEIDELRLPLSIVGFFKERRLLREIEVNKMMLTIREAVEDCGEVQSPQVLKVAPAVQLTPLVEESSYQNYIQSVSVADLQVNAIKYPQFSSQLKRLTARVKSNEPKVIELRASTHLFKDLRVGDYLSHANLFVEYRESPQVKIQSHFFGNWREGHYSLIANYTLDEKLVELEADLKHIPLSQILNILQNYGLVSKELNGKKAWISTRARWVAPFEKLRQSPLEIRQIQLEGDMGEFNAENLVFDSLEPLRHSPIFIDIKRLDVAKVLYLFNRPQSFSILNQLGTFTGRAEITSDQKMLLTGEHSGLEFIFSNKGEREIQSIDKLICDITMDKKDWTFSIHRIDPRGGTFVGNVFLKFDRDLQDFEIKAQVDELILANNVQKLMTNKGQIGAASFTFDSKFKKQRLEFFKGAAHWDGMTVEGYQLGKTKLKMAMNEEALQVNTAVDSIKLDSLATGSAKFKELTIPEWWVNQNLVLSNFSGTFLFREPKILNWNSVQANIGNSGKFFTEGSWDREGRLKGKLQSRDGNNQKTWSIQGDRQSPLFVEEKLNTKGGLKK